MSAIAVFVIAFVIYWFSSYITGRTVTPKDAHFPQLAESFLNGQFHINDPLSFADLSKYQGRYYIAFPPLPALLMMPGVALFGLNGFNVMFFVNFMGACTVALVFLILAALSANGWTSLGQADNLWITALFGVGSVHWYMCTLGTVWFVSQICVTTFIALAVWLACAKRHPFFVGSALALAMLGRPHVVLTYPLLLAVMAHGSGLAPHSLPWAKLKRGILYSLLPLGAAVVCLLWYNWMRFDSATDFGYLRQNISIRLRDDLGRYGQFDIRYIARNLQAMLLATPLWSTAKSRLTPSLEGMSILLTTPALIYIVRTRCRSWLPIGAWTALALLIVPVITYYNTGYAQFGYRFSLDFMLPMVVLLALGVDKRISWLMRALIIAGVLINAWGVAWYPNPVV
jgi:hypothetical protein